MSPRISFVLLPGMDGTGDLFDDFVAALDPAHRSIVVRYPVDEPLDYATLVESVRASLPREEPFVLVGESFSGPIAIALAASRPTNLVGLVLVASFVRNPIPSLTSLVSLVDWVPFGVMPHVLATPLLLGRRSTPKTRDAFVRAISRVSPDVIRARLRSIANVDGRDELARVTVPILYVRATGDRLVPASNAELVRSVRPDARIVDVDAPHLLLQVVPNRAAEVVAAFAADLETVLAFE